MHAETGMQGCRPQECVSLTQGSYGTCLRGDLMLDLTDWQNKKYMTLRGTEAVILAIDAPGPQPIIGYLKHRSSDIDGVTVCSWAIDGDFRLEGKDDMNLINAKTKREGWVNVFKNGSIEGTFSSKQLADASAVGSIRVACLRIEWEE